MEKPGEKYAARSFIALSLLPGLTSMTAVTISSLSGLPLSGLA
jgi:hypothetical protein